MQAGVVRQVPVRGHDAEQKPGRLRNGGECALRDVPKRLTGMGVYAPFET